MTITMANHWLLAFLFFVTSIVTFCVSLNDSAHVIVNQRLRRQVEFTGEFEPHWTWFKQQFNRNYETDVEHNQRREIFRKNHEIVIAHNQLHQQGQKTFKLGFNDLADWSDAEYSILNGLLRFLKFDDHDDQGDAITQPTAAPSTTIPESIDWRDDGYVTPVRNQGLCGGCYSFSATGSLEGQHKRKTGELVALSQQNVLDCSSKYGNIGCQGGLMNNVFRYVKANDGIDTLRSYPYEAAVGDCRFLAANVGATDDGYVNIPQGGEEKLKIALATVGPISVGIKASLSSFKLYETGVYSDPDCTSDGIDHGVLVVGYGNDPDYGSYWLVKNSWGTSWGENGYVKIARNQNNMCGISSMASYPTI